MAAVMVNNGERWAVNAIVGASTYTLHLIKSDFTVDPDMDAGDVEEADFGNYSSQAISGWSTALTDGSGKAYSIADHIEFIKSGGSGNDIHGWWIVENSGNTMVSIEKFSSPVPMQDDDQNIMILPKLMLYSAN